MKLLPMVYAVVTAGALGASLAVAYVSHARGSAALPLWQRLVDPGPLSEAHAFLANDCQACHAPHQGVRAALCIACHAADEVLLGRQATAFHATIGDCRGCHLEHLGRSLTRVMDHRALVVVGRRAGALPDPVTMVPPHARITPEEAVLDCNSCHANQSPHRDLFGNDCAVCHGTGQWSIPGFRHPSPLSTDCAQCHQAPPSHYMEHFAMVSMKVAGVEHAQVSQCFLCHKTNAWNDIRGVGWYKHH